jgi:hypothetical protein
LITSARFSAIIEAKRILCAKGFDEIRITSYYKKIGFDYAHMPGSHVRIKMASPEGYHPEKAYSIIDGRVIRCAKVNDVTSRFGLGTQILGKTIEAHIPESRLK